MRNLSSRPALKMGLSDVQRDVRQSFPRGVAMGPQAAPNPGVAMGPQAAPNPGVAMGPQAAPNPQ